MTPGKLGPHGTWTSAGLGPALGTGLLWGIAFAVLELAFFTSSNAAYPVGVGHFLLFLLLAVQTTAVAWVATVAMRATGFLWRGNAPALAAWAGPLTLLLILTVSHYRDRMVIHARSAGDLLATAGIVLGFGVALLLLGRWAAGRPAAVTQRILGGLGAATLVGALGWFLAVRTPEALPAPENPVSAADIGPVEDTGLRVLIVGLDGVDWKVLDPLLAEGRMPATAGLVARGATAALESEIPTYSPNLWTTIASGKTLEKHGVPSHVFTRLPLGLPTIVHDYRHIKSLTKILKFDIRMAHRAGWMSLGVYGSGNVRTRRLWDIAGDFGLRSVVLEWYVTHPARPVNGIQISSRFHLLTEDTVESGAFPAELGPALASHIVRPEDALDRISRMAHVDGLDPSAREAFWESAPDVIDGLSREMARDLTTQGLVPDAFPVVPDWRLGMVYYRGMDGSHHVSWKYREMPDGDFDQYPERRLRTVVDEYYEFGDGLLATALEQADENTVVIALSDHGWESQLYGHARKPDGFCILAGGPVVPTDERRRISVYDITPTALALLGIPVPEDMDGRVATEFFDPAFWEKHPVQTVTSYEVPGHDTVDEGDMAADDAVLEQLRTLGYVGD